MILVAAPATDSQCLYHTLFLVLHKTLRERQIQTQRDRETETDRQRDERQRHRQTER